MMRAPLVAIRRHNPPGRRPAEARTVLQNAQIGAEGERADRHFQRAALHGIEPGERSLERGSIVCAGAAAPNQVRFATPGRTAARTQARCARGIVAGRHIESLRRIGRHRGLQVVEDQ
jgi:hypothetical protein